MVAARKSSQPDEASLDESVTDGDEEEELDELEEDPLEEAFDDEPEEDLDAESLEPESFEAQDLEGAGDEEVAEGGEAIEDPDVPPSPGVAPPPDASFDDDTEEGLVAAVTGEAADHEIEGVRDGEFVCRSCYMAKRDTQLADPEQLLCLDCA